VQLVAQRVVGTVYLFLMMMEIVGGADRWGPGTADRMVSMRLEAWKVCGRAEADQLGGRG
jgi:hypothetical protein